MWGGGGCGGGGGNIKRKDHFHNFNCINKSSFVTIWQL